MIEYGEALTKVGMYASLLGAIGVSVSAWIRWSDAGPGGSNVAGVQRLASLGGSLAAVLLACLGLRVLAHTVAVFGGAEAWSVDSLLTIAVRSRWGGAWRWQVVAAIASMLLWRNLRRRPSAGRLAACAVALIATSASFALMGHAAGSHSRALVHTVHMLAAGAWVGTLSVLVYSGLPPEGFRRFSPVALTGSALGGVSGVVLVLFYIGAPAHLWTTSYGWWLLTKAAALSVTAACGFVNWRRVRVGDAPTLGTVEIVSAAVVVCVTAMLTETAHP